MGHTVFRCRMYQRPLDWKSSSNGSSALPIEGARRVGKSTIVEEFGRNEYHSHLLIDFMRPLPGTIELFESYSHDIGLLMSHLSLLYNVRLKQRDSSINMSSSL